MQVNPYTRGCLLIPHLALQLAMREHPELVGSPVAIATAGQRGVLIDCSREAQEMGLRPGIAARDAQGLAPQATILLDDPLAAAHEQKLLLHGLYQVCPTLRGTEPGRIDLDLRGLERHYPTLESLGQALLASVGADLRPRIGIAGSSFVAFIAARRTPSGTLQIANHEQSRQLLARCPFDLLPLEPAVIERMRKLGLRRLGDLAQLPRTAMLAQFGRHGGDAWDLAQGRDADIFVPLAISEPLVEQLRLPTPTNMESELAVGLRIATGRLVNRPEIGGRALRRVRLDLKLEQGGAVGREFLVKDGTRDVRRLVAMLCAQLGNLNVDAPVSAIQLEVLDLGEQVPQQLRLDGESQRARNRLHGAIVELAQRYGVMPIYQAVEVNPWARLPEHRWALAVYEP